MRKYCENLIKTDIRELTADDTIYISKLVNGYSHSILCKFIKFEAGVVTGIPISVDPDWAKAYYFDRFNDNEPIIITARIKKCYLYGSLPEDQQKYCHWFNQQGKI